MSRFSEDLAVMQANGYKLNGRQIQFPIWNIEGVSVEDLNLSVRAGNGLKRAGIMTIDEIIGRDLGRVRNLGAVSVKEIKNAVLNYSYEHMTPRQKKEFWESILV